MIIVSKGHVRMKGSGADILSEFATTAVALMKTEEAVTPVLLKMIIDIGYMEMKEESDNDQRSN